MVRVFFAHFIKKMLNLNATFYINTYLLIKQERFPDLILCIYDHIFDRIFNFDGSERNFAFRKLRYPKKISIEKNTYIRRDIGALFYIKKLGTNLLSLTLHQKLVWHLAVLPHQHQLIRKPNLKGLQNVPYHLLVREQYLHPNLVLLDLCPIENL